MNIPNGKSNHEIVAPDYFDLETCLAEASLFESKAIYNASEDVFKILGQDIQVPKISENDDVEKAKGFEVNIPLWSAVPLARYATIYLPEYFKPEALETIKADANIIPVNEIHRYYYAIGRGFAKITDDGEARRILNHLHYLYRNRLEGLLKTSQCSAEPMTKSLVRDEKEFFDVSRNTYQELINWWRYQSKDDVRKRKCNF
uniref:DNA replication complex GINS protein PSF3 n=1 Tax=Strongyloides papillosus TaxID=174720 RepID=A0A0N5BYE3_STREA